MSSPSRAHFLLFAEARSDGVLGRWRFVLTQVGARDSFAASDVETIGCRERLELLAVVRGLEALDEAARVTLVTNSRYVNRGLKHGLADWRQAEWQWERFGQLVPVRDRDLWRRVDRALQFHELDCRLWRFDAEPADATPLEAEHDHDFDHDRQPQISRLRRVASSAPWREAPQHAGLAAG